MSVARKVEVKYDLTVLAQVARALGFNTYTNAPAHGYYGEVMAGANNCDLVIKSHRHKFDMGFVKQPNGALQLVADFHGGYVQKDMAETILPRYVERMLEVNGRGRFQLQDRLSQAKSVVMNFLRR